MHLIFGTNFFIFFALKTTIGLTKNIFGSPKLIFWSIQNSISSHTKPREMYAFGLPPNKKIDAKHLAPKDLNQSDHRLRKKFKVRGRDHQRHLHDAIIFHLKSDSCSADFDYDDLHRGLAFTSTFTTAFTLVLLWSHITICKHPSSQISAGLMANSIS